MNAPRKNEASDPLNNRTTSCSNCPVPPPVPEAARHRVSDSQALPFVHGRLANRDSDVADVTLFAERQLTLPPSPPVPRTRGRTEWKLVGAVALTAMLSTTTALGAAWLSQHRPPRAASTSIDVILMDAKPRAVREPVHAAPVTTAAVREDAAASSLRPPRVVASRTRQTAGITRNAHVPDHRVDALTPEVPMLAAVDMAQQHARGAVMMCGMGVPNATRWVRAVVTYGSDGVPSHVDLSTPWSGTAPGRCIEQAIRARATLPPFAAQSYRTNFVFEAQ
jgi:hypothetical protein